MRELARRNNHGGKHWNHWEAYIAHQWDRSNSRTSQICVKTKADSWWSGDLIVDLEGVRTCKEPLGWHSMQSSIHTYPPNLRTPSSHPKINQPLPCLCASTDVRRDKERHLNLPNSPTQRTAVITRHKHTCVFRNHTSYWASMSKQLPISCITSSPPKV